MCVTLCSGRWGRLVSIELWFINVNGSGNDTVQLWVALLTLMHQKWLLCERGSCSVGRGQKKKKKRTLFSSWLTLNTAISQHPSQPVRWHGCGFCSAVGGGKTRKDVCLLGPGKKKSTALCSESTETLIASRRWAAVSQSSSPYPCERWHFHRDGSFCSFLALSCCFKSAADCFYLACRAVWQPHYELLAQWFITTD